MSQAQKTSEPSDWARTIQDSINGVPDHHVWSRLETRRRTVGCLRSVQRRSRWRCRVIERQSPAARESCTSSNTTSKKDPHFYPDVSQNTTSRCIWRIMHGDMTLATKRGRVGKQENVPVHKNDPRIFSLVELD